MNIEFPLFIVVFFPKKWKESYVQRQWDRKTDEDVLYAFKDRMELIGHTVKYPDGFMPTLKKIAESSQRDLDERIIPQMQKRGLGDYNAN